jgi:uncharacterized FAD-dependent dehydrogenase
VKIELQFRREDSAMVHEKNLLYESTIPIPSVGDKVIIEVKRLKIMSRTFCYCEDGSIMVEFQCTTEEA